MNSNRPEVGTASRRRRRFGFAFASFAFLVTMFGTTLPTPLYPLYQKQFGLSELMITVIYAAYAAGVIAALILLGRWSDQLGRRRLFFAAFVFSAASAIVFIFDAGLGPLLLGRVLSGVSAGIATGTATVFVIELAPEARRARATLVATAVNMLGLGLGPLIAGLLAQYALLPFRLVFLFDLFLLALATLGLLFTPETVKAAGAPDLSPQRLVVPREVRNVFIPASIAGFAGFAVFGFFTAVTPAFLGKLLRIPNLAVTGAVVFLVFAASAAGQLALERIPKAWALPSGCMLLAAGALWVGAGIGVESLALLMIGAAIAGLGQGVAFRAGMGAITAASPANRRGEVTSTFFVVLYVAISIPVIGVGVMTDFLGLRIAGVAFAIAVAILSLIALGLLLRRPRRTN